MPVRKKDIPDDVLTALNGSAETEVPDDVLAAFGEKKSKVNTGNASVTGTGNISQSTLPSLSPEEVAKGIFSFGQMRTKKTPLPANIPQTERDISSVLKSVHFGTANPKQLADLYNNANGKEVATQIIKQYVPEATDQNIANPVTLEAASKNIKKANRINYVNAEKAGIEQLDENAKTIISDLSKPKGYGGSVADVIDEYRSEIAITNLDNNDEIANAIDKITKADNLENKYVFGDVRKQQKEKTNAALKLLNDRLNYNISRTGVSETINQLDTEIGQAVLSKVMESERGEDLAGEAGKDNVKVSQFKLGLSAIEKSDPVLFKNVVNGIAQKQKVSDTDFSNIAKVGQQIDNQVRFRGAAYDPTLIDTETSFEYDTFGQKKAAASAQIGEWLKSKGYKNQSEFSEKQIRQAAKEVGIENPEIVNSLIFEEKLGGYDAIPKSGWVDDVAAGIMQPLVGINSTLNSWNESPAETYLRSKSLDATLGSQKVPDKEGQYSDILPSERGKFTTDMFRGLGQFIPQVLLTKGVGATLEGVAGLAGAALSAKQAKNVADYGGTFVSTFLQSYGPSYEEHLQKTGDAETAALIGTIDGTASAAFELLLPDVKIADQAFSGLKGALATDLISLIKKGGDPAELATKARPFIQKFFTKATGNILQEDAEELGTQYVDFVTESIFDPKSAKDRNLNKELWDTFKSTTAAMLLPSILGAGGGSFTKDFTTKSLHSAAINLDSYKESLQNSLDKEYISQEDFNKSVKILETHKQSINAAPEINANGATIAPEKKLDYALEDTKIKVYKAKASETEGVAKEMWEQKIKQAEDVQREILMPKQQESEVVQAPESGLPAVETNSEGILTEGNIKTSQEIETDLVSQLGEERSQEAISQVKELVDNDLIPQSAIAGSSLDIQKNPISFLKFIAEQAQGEMEFQGKTISSKNLAIEKYGEGVVAMAEDFFPNEKPQQTASQESSQQPEVIQEGAVETIDTETASIQDLPKSTRERYVEDFNIVDNSKFDWRVKSDLSTKDRAKAVLDIKEGKNTAAARKLNQEMDEMESRGTVIINRGRGNNAETVEIPINDWFSINPQEQNAAIELDESTTSIINDNDVTLNNIDDLKNLFNGFPYDQKDFAAVKEYLTGKSKGNEQNQQNSESGQATQKPKVRVSAEQVERAQPKKETKVDRKALSDQLKSLLSGQGLALNRGQDTNPSSRISYADIGLDLNDNIEQAIDKLISYGGEFTDILIAIKADANIKNVKLFLDTRPTGDNGESGLYFPVGNPVKELNNSLISYDGDNVYYTLTHELMHFFTLDSKAAEDVKDSEGYKGIEELYNYIAAKKGKPISGSATIESYGLTNVKEFMAELLINPTFRNYVSDVFVENKDDILKTNKQLRDAKVTSIGDMILNLFKDLFSKVFTSGKGVDIDTNKSAIDNAARIATELFFGGKDVSAGQSQTADGGTPLVPTAPGSLSLPSADNNKKVNDFENKYDKNAPGIMGPIIKEKEASEILEYLSKKYGISGALEDMGLLGARGYFHIPTLQIKINRQSTLDDKGSLTAALSNTGNLRRRTIFHEYLHPFVDLLIRGNTPLYDAIFEKAKKTNDSEGFADVSHYPFYQQKEELVVRYLERLSDNDKPPTILQKFLKWISDFFYGKKKKGSFSDIKMLSPETTVDELYNVFKNYGLIEPDMTASEIGQLKKSIQDYEEWLRTDKTLDEETKNNFYNNVLPELRSRVEELEANQTRKDEPRQSKAINDFIKASFEKGATEEDIKGALVDNGFTDEEATKFVESNRKKQATQKQKIEQKINDIGKNSEDVLLDSVEHRRQVAAGIAVEDTAKADKLKLELVQQDANAFIEDMKHDYGKTYLNKTLSAITGLNKNRVNLDKILGIGVALENEINGIKEGFVENEFNISRSELNKVYAQIQKVNVENARISSKALNTIKTLYNNYDNSIAKENILTPDQSAQKEAIMEAVLNEERLSEAADAHESGVQLTEESKQDVAKKDTRVPKKITEKSRVRAKLTDIITDLKDKLNKLDC